MAKRKHKGRVPDGRLLIATNRKARHDFEVIETLEAGVMLSGPEVKSLRQGKASLPESYAVIKRGEVWLVGAHIPPYEPAAHVNADPARRRKLLLHRREIKKLEVKLAESGLTLVPLSLYFTRRGLVKVQLGLARRRRKHDKRQKLARQDAQRELRQYHRT